MRYFKLVVNVGHQGRGRTRDIPVFIFEKDMTSAMKRAMNMPGVKHDKIPLSAKEITKEEYDQGIQENAYKKFISNRKKGCWDEESYNLHWWRLQW